jgi:metal-responsive CopG/Arc/MetJ family transcriptional regulator
MSPVVEVREETKERGKGERGVVISVKLPKQLFDIIEEYRLRYGLSRADVIRIALAEYFDARRREGS